MLPRDLLLAIRAGADGDILFPSPVLQRYFEALVPPRLRRPAPHFVLAAAMHAAVQGLNHRYLSRQAILLGLHHGDPDLLLAALRQIRPDFALHLLPAGPDAVAQITHLATGPRRVEALLCTPRVAAADRRAALAAAGPSCLVQVFANPDAADAGATLWRPAEGVPAAVGLVA
ncbi:hypothetical protein [Falsiroseomonas selenitidurans]|uniref:Uncharacterized protein n=1 Tax=Falsiroseomonas selenitidurans TaxID=2716335 RepID=A0ABX1E557_9PROT|nr:hypothetical protein [Falsiroseomonas selenitidurans]NKC32133.1 hypothetical protein [Falsiroseomonas selenitidurans]